jgi:hypothetical protein
MAIVSTKESWNALPSFFAAENSHVKIKELRRAQTSGPYYSKAHIVPRELSRPDIPTARTVPALKPLFMCNDPNSLPGAPGRTQKLAFVHIFKTAGSSLRVFFRKYAEQCDAGWQVIIRCTGVEASSVKQRNSTWWHIENDAACVQKKGIMRGGGAMEDYASFNSHHLDTNVDILGGHMELGAADYSWVHHDDLTYISFFRNAASKFVSARMYKKKRTLNEHVDVIRDVVEMEMKKNLYYEGYYNYLVTPFQKEEIALKGLNLTLPEKVTLMQKNLIDYNVVCGMTERMPASLEILHYLIDSDDSARDLFEAEGMPNKGGQQISEVRIRNRAEIPTSAVLSELAKDPVFYTKLLEYVKYEQQVTEFALQIHIHQHESISFKREK